MSSIKTMYTALSGMKKENREIETIGSNISNINTTGFKRSMIMKNTYTNERTTRNEKLTEMSYDLTQGGVVSTQNIFDLAVIGDGFLSVQMPDGQVGYSRDGSLSLDENRTLSNSQGYPLLVLNENNEPVTVTVGELDSFTVSSQGMFELGGMTYNLGLVKLNDPDQLERSFGNTFVTNEAPVIASDSRVIQGALEGSNVDLTREFTDLMIANRQLQASYNALKTVDGLVEKNIEEVGKL